MQRRWFLLASLWCFALGVSLTPLAQSLTIAPVEIHQRNPSQKCLIRRVGKIERGGGWTVVKNWHFDCTGFEITGSVMTEDSSAGYTFDELEQISNSYYGTDIPVKELRSVNIGKVTVAGNRVK